MPAVRSTRRAERVLCGPAPAATGAFEFNVGPCTLRRLAGPPIEIIQRVELGETFLDLADDGLAILAVNQQQRGDPSARELRPQRLEQLDEQPGVIVGNQLRAALGLVLVHGWSP